MDKPDSISIPELTKELESGDTRHLGQALQSEFREDRIAVLQKIKEQNEKDRKADASLPAIRLEVRSYLYGISTKLTLDRHTFSDGFWGPPSLYSDVLDIQRLPAWDGSKATGKACNIDVRALTTQLESGNGKGITDLFNGVHEEDRIRILRQVQQLNNKDVSESKTPIQLSVNTYIPKAGHETTVHVTRSVPHTWDWFWGGREIFTDHFNWINGNHTITEAVDPRK